MDYSWVLLTLGISLIAGKLGDHFMEKLKLPGVLGEILMGMFLGNLIYFGFIDGNHLTLHNNEIFEFLSKLGIIFLLFLGGLDTNIAEVKKTGAIATVSTVFGVLFPLVMGYLALVSVGYPSQEAFAAGVILTATSIGLTVRVMMDLGVLKTDVGYASLSASIMDDFLGIMLIIFVVGMGDLTSLFGKLGLFVIIGFIGWKLIGKYISFAEKLHVQRGILSFILALLFIFSFLAENWFEAAIEGSFLAGLILSKTPEGKAVMNDVKTIGYSFLIPLFFVYTGASLDLGVFGNYDALSLAVILTVVAVISKVVGRGLGAKLMGWTTKKSLQMGIGSIPRAEIALINLMVAVNAGIISAGNVPKFIAATLIFITVSILITPPLLKWAFKDECTLN
ncbi:cation:proton antiporter [Methanococcus voltae]|uniref:Kef-type K+ transport system membrane component KefB n=2 Tax=Methanococcus voltae TaxID=2188 RepID=A0A8J7URI5_METVO|nr:cation:proton antiporter [Methanococcus voltae]MBP2172752.1 Kef-type K+ transport system membrane component KefB [Methanococcus voltae]MBP2201838.1 Kef-type K+ transport system membrane component KefB [Methanococcus voltae]MCS3922662.1 Kef-type K+ transport system membrane component KefB [Methanococcus voltae PS]